MVVVGFDLDGTLIESVGGVDYESPDSLRESCRPIVRAVERARDLAVWGARVVYVTGRAEPVRAVTTVQIAKFGLPPGALLMSVVWEGYEAMAQAKAKHLLAAEAAVYVGDHEADRKAARLAGVPFVHAEEFWAGALDPRRLDASRGFVGVLPAARARDEFARIVGGEVV